MLNKDLIEKIKKGHGITHPGMFHADDVLSTCLIRMINPLFKIKRTDQIPENYTGVVYDIGLGRYDHHQQDAEERANGIKYAAFGLLWRDLSEYFMDEEHASAFDAAFISEMDRCDNCSDNNLLTTAIKNCNRTWNSDEDADVLFEKTVDLFIPVMRKLIQHFKMSTYIPRFCADMDNSIKIALRNLYEKKTEEDITISDTCTTLELWDQYSDILTPNENSNYFKRIFLSQVNKTYGQYKTSPFILAMVNLSRTQRVKLLETLMERCFLVIDALGLAKEKTEQIYENSKEKNIIDLGDRYIPYDTMSNSHLEVKAVMFKSDRGYMMVFTNMTNIEKKKKCLNPQKQFKRMEVPVELRLEESELRVHFPGITFVHPSGHLVAGDSKKSLYNFYKICLKNESYLT